MSTAPGTPAPGTPAPDTPVPDSPGQDDVAARRRQLVVPIAFVALLVVLGTGIGIWSLLAHDDAESDGANRPATLVRIDTDRNELEVYDELGEHVTATLDLSDGGFPSPLGDGRLYDGSALDDGDLRVYDLAAGTMGEYAVSEEAGYVVPLGDHLIVVGPDSGVGDLDVVDTATGDVGGVGDAVHVDSRWTTPVFDPPAGAMSAMAIDADERTNVVVPETGLADAWTVGGRLLDLWSGDVALVANPVTEESSTLTFEGPDGPVGKAAEFDGVVAGGMAVGDRIALVVELEGSLRWFDAGAGTVAGLDDLDVGEVHRVQPLATDRLLIVGDRASVLVDGEGTVMAQWGHDELDTPVVASPGLHCVGLRPSDLGTVDPGGMLIDLGNGEDLVDLDGMPVAHGDGCSVIVIGADTEQVVIGGKEVDLGDVAGSVRGIDPLRGRILVLEDGDDHAYRLVDTKGETVAELGDGPWILVS